MATNYNAKLTEDEKQNMANRLQCYLGRHIVTIPPMPHRDLLLPLIVSSQFNGPEYEVWANVRKLWLDKPDKTPHMMASVQSMGYDLMFDGGHAFGLQAVTEVLTECRIPSWLPVRHTDRHSGNPVLVSEVVPEQVLPEFTEWCHTSVLITERVCRTWNVLHDVLRLASTVGQLHRMMPDLLKYVYDTTKQALEQQQRRSPLPQGWMDIDRAAIRHAGDHLALCHMLPQQPFEERNWHRADEGFQHHMGGGLLAFGKTGREYMGYHAQMQTRKPRHFSFATLEGELTLPDYSKKGAGD